MPTHNLEGIAYHRNGCAGAGFHVLRFKARDGRKNRNMVAVAFEEEGHIAIFDQDMLAQGIIAFGENSWRYENYDTEIRQWIAEFQADYALPNIT